MTADGPVLDDRRATAVAAGLVGAVVLVLGFGSGIGSVWSRDAKASSSSSGHDLGTEVQQGDVAVGVVPPAATAPLQGARRISAISDVVVEPTTVPFAPTPAGAAAGGATMTMTTPTTSTTSTTSGPSGPTTGATCARGLAEDALTPFLVHLDKAHLEESPGQQVAQALDLDQYVQTHTVLVEQMLEPVVDTVLVSLQGLPPLWTHLEKAHLEESPGQQVAQALDVDQYVQTHTVLVEDMLAPAMDAVTGSGCGS